MQSIILKQFGTPKQAIEALNNAHTTFRAYYKRGAKMELAYGETGTLTERIFYVSAWYEGQAGELEWFTNYFNVLAK